MCTGEFAKCCVYWGPKISGAIGSRPIWWGNFWLTPGKTSSTLGYHTKFCNFRSDGTSSWGLRTKIRRKMDPFCCETLVRCRNGCSTVSDFFTPIALDCTGLLLNVTRSSADADNRLDAFSGQSSSTNMVPFHMLHIVSYCAIVTLSLRRAVFTIFVFKKFHDLHMGSKVTQGYWEWYHLIDCVWFPISVL